MKKFITLAAVAVVAVLTLTGCTGGNNAATQADQAASNSQLQRLQANQPIPQSDWSQYRQTAIDVELAQIHGVATTTFFFNQGTPNPIAMCPSIGFPVPTTAQLTNPDQIAYNGSGSGGGYGVISQLEPNGTYTGDSSGTNVVCVAPSGATYIQYAEEIAHTVGGAAHWDKAQGVIILDGEPTVEAKTQQK